MGKQLILSLIFAVWICLSNADEHDSNTDSGTREEKHLNVLPVFEVIKFANSICPGAIRNGTCYTAAECTSRGGVVSGDACSSGYGVCCVFDLACGGSSSDNNSYIVQASVTTLGTNCKYTICPTHSSIKRIRFDFNTLTIAGPVGGTYVTAANKASEISKGSLGSCATDQFQIIGVQSSPVICGNADGRHMILDSDGSTCLVALFGIGSSLSATRHWDIWVTQYTQAQIDEFDRAGPVGCLEYLTGKSGWISSYNFPSLSSLGTAAEPATTATMITQLNNQNYKICIKREAGINRICYSAVGGISATTAGKEAIATKQGTFGLSVSTAADLAQAGTGTSCLTDYIVIPGGEASATGAVTIAGQTKWCGRYLGTHIATAHATICTLTTPFQVGFVTDGFEAYVPTPTADMLTMTELEGLPGGTLGFGLVYLQGTN